VFFFAKNINDYFSDLLNDLSCGNETKSYIASIYGKFKNSKNDLSKDSIVLLFCQARHKHDFSSYQDIGDWIFFSNTIFNNLNEDLYKTFAKLSFYSCYKMTNKKFLFYEELADNLTILEYEVKEKLSTIMDESQNNYKLLLVK